MKKSLSVAAAQRRLKWTLKPLAFFLMLGVGGHVYGADSLDELIAKSVQSYPSVKSKEMTRKSAKGDVLTAKLGFLPSASVAFEPGKKVYSSTTAGKSDNYSTDPYTVITLTQPLFGGGLVPGYRLSKANLNAADWALREEMDAVALRVLNAYSSWYSASKKVAATQESVKEHERMVGLITRRAEAGASPATDQNLGVSRLLQSKAELAAFMSAENTALTALNQLAGERLTREQLLANPIRLDDYAMPNDIVAKAIAINPNIKRLEAVAEAARQTSRVVRAQALPQVSLQAKRQLGAQDTNSDSLFKTQPKNTFGVVVNYTTGAGFASISKVGSANSRYEASLLDIDTAKRDLIVRINQDVSDYGFAKSRAQALLQNVKLSNTVSESYGRLFLVGKKSWLDLVNAVRERKETQVSLADVQSQMLLTSRRLGIYAQGLDYDALLGMDAPQPIKKSKKAEKAAVAAAEAVEAPRNPIEDPKAAVIDYTSEPQVSKVVIADKKAAVAPSAASTTPKLVFGSMPGTAPVAPVEVKPKVAKVSPKEIVEVVKVASALPKVSKPVKAAVQVAEVVVTAVEPVSKEVAPAKAAVPTTALAALKLMLGSTKGDAAPVVAAAPPVAKVVEAKKELAPTVVVPKPAEVKASAPTVVMPKSAEVKTSVAKPTAVKVVEAKKGLETVKASAPIVVVPNPAEAKISAPKQATVKVNVPSVTTPKPVVVKTEPEATKATVPTTAVAAIKALFGTKSSDEKPVVANKAVPKLVFSGAVPAVSQPAVVKKPPAVVAPSSKVSVVVIAPSKAKKAVKPAAPARATEFPTNFE